MIGKSLFPNLSVMQRKPKEPGGSGKRQAELSPRARRQAREIVAKGREAAERIAQDIEDRAKTEANKLLLGAKQEIENEREKAISFSKWRPLLWSLTPPLN